MQWTEYPQFASVDEWLRLGGKFPPIAVHAGTTHRRMRGQPGHRHLH
jgi:hypothetical protein